MNGNGPHNALPPNKEPQNQPKKGWSKGKIAAAGAGVLLFGILIGQCGDSEPTAQPQPEQTTTAPQDSPEPTRAPEPTDTPSPEPDPTPEVVEEVVPEPEEVDLPPAAGEALLVSFVRGEHPDGTLIPMLTDEQIVAAGYEVCARFDAAPAGQNLMMTLSLEHIVGNGFVPNYVEGYGTDNEELGTLLGASVPALCPQHQDRMLAEADAMAGA